MTNHDILILFGLWIASTIIGGYLGNRSAESENKRKQS